MNIRTLCATVMLLSIGLLASNSNAAGEPEISLGVKQSSIAQGEFDPRGYFTFRPDYRKCASPLCGGIFVKAVNQKLTRCANGRWQAECYVASINSPDDLDFTGAGMLQGRIKSQNYPGFGNLGAFELQAAYSPATDRTGTGKLFGLENNGIVCISSPCFSFDQYQLNNKKMRGISGIDLEQLGASEEIVKQAWAIMAEGGVLIASGINKQVDELAGTGVSFVADQIYLPLGKPAK